MKVTDRDGLERPDGMLDEDEPHSARPNHWHWLMAAMIVLSIAYGAAQLLFPKKEPALTDLEVLQVELPDPLPTNLKNEKSAILVVRIALDYRARNPREVEEAVTDPAVRNRITDAMIEFYTNKTMDEVSDPIHWALERRQLKQRLGPILFPDPTQGRIEQVLFLQHNIQL